MKYAIKKGDKYKSKRSWNKDIMKATLFYSIEDINYLKSLYPNYYKDCDIVSIIEKYTREEVKE